MKGIAFMLAKSADMGPEFTETPRYAFQRKLDGTRCAVVIDGGDVTLIGRGEKQDRQFSVETDRGWQTRYNHQFPEIVRAFEAIAGGMKRTVIDGEIVCLDPKTKEPTFSLVQRRMNRVDNVDEVAKECPAVFRAFDILEYDGYGLTEKTLNDRWEQLRLFLTNDMVIQLEPLMLTKEDKSDLWNEVLHTKQEGVMVKDLHSTYVGGRSSSWLKVKRIDTFDVVVTGWVSGTGKRAGEATNVLGSDISVRGPDGKPLETFGALRCAVYRFSPLVGTVHMVDVGEVGGGFTNEALVEITLNYLAPEGKLKKPLVIEVQCFGLAKKGGKMRFPQFVRIRTDKSPSECTYNQFE